MTLPHVRTGLITIAHGELFASVPTQIPGHLSLRGHSFWFVIPVPAGVGDGPMGDMSGKELRDYLDHGMAFNGTFTLRDSGDGLKLVQASDLLAISRPDLNDQTLINGIMSAAEQVAAYRDARLKSGVEVTIVDWQGEAREDKTTPDAIRLTIQSEDQRLLITTHDGRKLDLELQDGVLRAMAYESEDGKQAPVITALPRSGEITIDRHDYDLEPRPEPDELSL